MGGIFGPGAMGRGKFLPAGCPVGGFPLVPATAVDDVLWSRAVGKLWGDKEENVWPRVVCEQ